ncbi:MAG: NAD-dependent epimerase/dehydratase family protein [bacterium]|nr:NAD-dependent epimerase/dehydratase family protein [bacterium]
MSKEKSLPPELEPSHYIEKVSLVTGEVLDDEIQPKNLLVGNHRDYHLADVQARRFMSRLLKATGDEELVREKMKDLRERGHRASEMIAKAIGQRDPSKVSKALFGLKRKEYYFRYRKPPVSHDEIDALLAEMREEAAERLAAATVDGRPALRVLLTGGTGFVGQEIMWQAAHDDDIAEMVVLIRPKVIRDRKTGEVKETLTPADRGEALLRRLWLDTPELADKFRFVAGDVEQPHMGLADDELERLRASLTHLIHCAASVAFDDPYEKSFRANVTGTLNALAFSHSLQSAEDSPFIAHLGIETSYIHGRQVKIVAREEEVVFPRNFYNNYYELTKAMASIETERFIVEKRLRVVELCPAIVIGESRAGNNRGDAKVVNAPVNVFGRAHQALSKPKGTFVDRSSAAMIAKMACVFPGDPSAEMNLIPVDRVVAGIVAALKKPGAMGRRIHLGTDNRLKSQDITEIVREEIGVDVKLADPTLHRNVTLPVLTKLLAGVKQERLGNALEKLGSIFGSYTEWGQPVHEVGRDVEILGLSPERPNTRYAFRMLCRHNRYVQDFGQVRDLDEISRREKIWWDFCMDLEGLTGGPVGAVSAEEFQRAIAESLDLEGFVHK